MVLISWLRLFSVIRRSREKSESRIAAYCRLLPLFSGFLRCQREIRSQAFGRDSASRPTSGSVELTFFGQLTQPSSRETDCFLSRPKCLQLPIPEERLRVRVGFALPSLRRCLLMVLSKSGFCCE